MYQMRVEFNNGVTWEWQGRMDRERMRWIYWNLMDKDFRDVHRAEVYQDGHLVIVIDLISVIDSGRVYRDLWIGNIPTGNTQLVRIMEESI